MSRRTPLAACRGLAVAAIVAVGACGAPGAGEQIDAATVARGAVALGAYGCGACHRIPGIAGATGTVGPSLEGVARRVYLAGVIPNTPANLVEWIRTPQQLVPLTAMPDMQVTASDAHAMAAYLGGLR